MPRTRRAPPLPPDARRRTIIDAVAPLLIADGANLTTKRMADAAGVAEGTLFTVFDDKRALIMAVLEDRLDPDPMAAALAAIGSGAPLRSSLVDAAAVVLPRIDEVRALAAALHGLPRGPAQGPRRDRHHLDAWSGAIRAGLISLMRPHERSLRWPPERLAELFTALLFASRPPWTVTSAPMGGPELVDVVLHGSLTDPAVGDRMNGAS